jgi:hypothetical protein
MFEVSSSAKADDPVFRNAYERTGKPRGTGYPLELVIGLAEDETRWGV